MTKKFWYLILTFTFCLPNLHAFAQRGVNWCFGDSAGINFTVASSPVIFTNSVLSRGTAVSISDATGTLQLYAMTDAQEAGIISGIVFNKNHEMMLNGDSLAGSGWYHEMVILPDPAEDSLFYLFSIGVSYSYGLKYSKIDLRGENGLGEVVQKNVSLLDSIYMVDGLTAVKHGNGRDWWLVARKWDYFAGLPWENNEWYVYLISNNGITMIPIQNVGSMNSTNNGRLYFDPTGNKMVFINGISLIELYDFNRCTGEVTNPVTIEQQDLFGVYPHYWTCQFSSSGRFLYIGSNSDTSKLYQFDTWTPAIDSTKTLLWQTSFPKFTMGDLKLAPDNKIYLSMCYVDSAGNDFPYAANNYASYNMNLSVINSPDSAGLACDFQPWSFYLGGKRTYWGLPNNPDYDLPALVGSPCDTLVGIGEVPVQEQQPNLYVYYSPQWQTAFINANQLKGTSGKLQVFDVIGNLVFEENTKFNPPYYTKNLNLTSLAKGMYVVTLEAGGQRLVKKFVVE
ncbi:MAG: T9SS type A sorting domain-containing protein [Bacteroidetes bacterium]|nr:T9SS type A sorting domain-containing protein [Bacteroidota bacterium]